MNVVVDTIWKASNKINVVNMEHFHHHSENNVMMMMNMDDHHGHQMAMTGNDANDEFCHGMGMIM
jgi:hypothetical protein